MSFAIDTKNKKPPFEVGKKSYVHFYIKEVVKEPLEQGKPKPRVIKGFASTESIDRVDESIRVDAWELDNFVKNPVFLWAHNSTEPPIGKAVKIEKQEGGLYFEAAESISNPFAKIIYDQYQAGEMKAFSVGFIPKLWEYYDAGGKQVMDWRDADKTIFTSVELLEISAVPVPCNQDALMIMFEKGLSGKPADFEPPKKVENLDAVVGMFANSHIKTLLDSIKEPEQLTDKQRKEILKSVVALQKFIGVEAQTDNREITLLKQIRDLEKDKDRLTRVIGIYEKGFKTLTGGIAH